MTAAAYVYILIMWTTVDGISHGLASAEFRNYAQCTHALKELSTVGIEGVCVSNR